MIQEKYQRFKYFAFSQKKLYRPMRIETLKEEIAYITEPRRNGFGNIRHKLEDIIIIGLCTVICGGKDFVEMEEVRQSEKRMV